MHHRRVPQLAQVLSEIVGKRVVVIEQQNFHYWRSQPALARRFPSAARLGSLHSLPLRRVAPFRLRWRSWPALARRFPSAARLGSLHSLPLRRVAPFRSRWRSRPALARRFPPAARLIVPSPPSRSPAAARAPCRAFPRTLQPDSNRRRFPRPPARARRRR